MTVGGRQYNEADMLQMQREAENRVREMQDRTRRTVAEASGAPAPASNPRAGGQRSNNRNWNSSTGMPRRMRWPGPQGFWQEPAQPGRQAGHSRPDSPAEPHQSPETGARDETTAEASSPPGDRSGGALPQTPPPKKDGTVIGDIMDALGLDEDYLLIIGLILILVNQRADTTLILALAYLLI